MLKYLLQKNPFVISKASDFFKLKKPPASTALSRYYRRPGLVQSNIFVFLAIT